MSGAVLVQGVSKRFRRYPPDRPLTLQEAFLGGFRSLHSKEVFWALRDVTFEISPGVMAGVIGPNGAGKSTLLRLIGGVGEPTQGSIQVDGRLGALIDLGAGFHPDLTGRENVYVNGVVSGLTRREVTRQFDSIVDFAELADFIDNPIRTYSTGMQMRLAFSIAVHIEPEVLLIDEVLAVGDIAFQQKCLDRIAWFKSQGCAILLVSHNTAMVAQLCDEALWMRAGRLVAHGRADMVVGEYVAEMRAETRKRTPTAQPALHTSAGTELRINENRFGSLEMEIVDVRLTDPLGVPVTELDSGAPLTVTIRYRAPQPITAPIFGLSITKVDGFVCYDTSTAVDGCTLPVVHGEGQIALHLERLDLVGDRYYLDVGVYKEDWTYAYDYHWHAYPIVIRPTQGEKGILRPARRWALGPEQDGLQPDR